MPTNINIQNNLSVSLVAPTTVSPALSSDYWGVSADIALGGQLTQMLWMDRNEGIKDGQTWTFTTSLTVAGVAIQLQEALTGTFANSDLAIQITAGSNSSGWASNNTSLLFIGNDGNTYQINGTFFLNRVFDDVTFSISQV